MPSSYNTRERPRIEPEAIGQTVAGRNDWIHRTLISLPGVFAACRFTLAQPISRATDGIGTELQPRGKLWS
jgi:hypothetical protein